MEKRKAFSKPPIKSENKVVPVAQSKVLATNIQQVNKEEVKRPLRNTSTKFNQTQQKLVKEEEVKDKPVKTGFTEKPSDRFKKVKAADPFSGGKKHKTNFGYVYSSGGVPIRINHGSVVNRIQWDKNPDGKIFSLTFLELDYDPLLINCFEGLLETEHPYALVANSGLQEMLQSPGAPEKTIPLVPKLIMPLRNAFMSADKEIWTKGLEALRQLSMTVGHNLTPHIHILLAQLNKKMTTKLMREKITGVLNTIEEQGVIYLFLLFILGKRST